MGAPRHRRDDPVAEESGIPVAEDSGRLGVHPAYPFGGLLRWPSVTELEVRGSRQSAPIFDDFSLEVAQAESKGVGAVA